MSLRRGFPKLLDACCFLHTSRPLRSCWRDIDILADRFQIPFIMMIFMAISLYCFTKVAPHNPYLLSTDFQELTLPRGFSGGLLAYAKKLIARSTIPVIFSQWHSSSPKSFSQRTFDGTYLVYLPSDILFCQARRQNRVKARKSIFGVSLQRHSCLSKHGHQSSGAVALELP